MLENFLIFFLFLQEFSRIDECQKMLNFDLGF